MSNTPDSEVAAWMREFGFEWIEVNKQYFGGGYWNIDLPDGKYMSVSPITAAFFHTTMKRRELEARYAELEKLSRKLNHDLEENQPVLLMIKDQQAELDRLIKTSEGKKQDE